MKMVSQKSVHNFLQVTVTLSRSNDFLNVGLDSNEQTVTSSVDKVERIQVSQCSETPSNQGHIFLCFELCVRLLLNNA